jgi:putative sigma-54 modulation protein
MEITMIGRGTTVTDALRAHTQQKIDDALKVLDTAPTSVDVVLRITNHKNATDNDVCEITLRLPGSVVRVASATSDMYASIDEASRMLARKLRKYKTRVIERRQRQKAAVVAEAPVPAEVLEIEEEEPLVRSKYIDYARYTEEDALVEADLLGHDFFVFTDMVTGNVHVIYHRKDGGYGILKPASEE